MELTQSELRQKRIDTLKQLAEQNNGLKQVAILNEELELFRCGNISSFEANLVRAIDTFLPHDHKVVANCGLGLDENVSGVRFDDRMKMAANILFTNVRYARELWGVVIDDIVDHYEIARVINEFAIHAIAESNHMAYYQLISDLTAPYRH